MRGKTTFHIRWKLFFYDVIVFAVTSVFLLVLYEGPVKLTQRGELQQMLLAFVCVFACRLVGKIYGQIWRYGGNSMLHAFSLYGLCGIFNICDFGICSSGRSYLISAPSGVEYGKHHGSADHENVLPLCV